MSRLLPLLSAGLVAAGLSLSLSSAPVRAADDPVAACKTLAEAAIAAGKDAKPDFAGAITQCETAAAKLGKKDGQNDIRVLLARLHDSRDDGAADRKVAVKLYTAAADKGDLFAQNRLGEIYRDGTGVDVDDKKAFALFEKAANSGYAPAMSNLGDAYTDGKGVEASDEKAVEWYRKGADLNNVDCWQSLAYAYDMGKGVPKDLTKALDGYQIAASLGNSNAMNNIGVLYENGEVVAQNYSAARGWYERAIAADDNSMAYYNLSVLYKEGRGVYVDSVKAGQLIAKALAENEDYAREELKTNPDHWNAQSWTEIQKAFAAERGYKGPIDGKPNPDLMALIAQPVE